MNFFGIQVDEISLKEARQRLAQRQLIFTPNPEILLEARRNSAFRQALAQGTLMLPDGHGLQLVSTLLRISSRLLRGLLLVPSLFLFLFWKKPFCGVIPELIHGSDFMDEVLARAEKEGWSVFFLGGRGDVAKRTAHFFTQRYPALKLAGFSSANPDEAFEEVKHVHPQVLLVAYGAPKQELWLAKHFDELPELRLAMGVGGSFDFYSGAIRRAPRFMRALGLEWLWRLFLNPVQRAKRIWNAVVVFPLLTILH